MSKAYRQSLESHKYIQVRELDNGVKSYNFTKQAFWNNVWDNTSVKARGLFMRGDKIIARGYDKFFNINQNPGYTYDEVINTFKFPVVISEKLNGFLAIASVLDDELVVYSKSGTGIFTIEADRIVRQSLGSNIDDFIAYLKRTNQSATFEIISDNDVHIIDEGSERAVLLDIIANSENYTPLSKEDTESIGVSLGLETANYKYVNTKEELDRELKTAYASKTEGVVVMDADGKMTKVKSDYYLLVKSLRTPIARYLKGKDVRQNELFDELMNNGLAHNLQLFTKKTLVTNEVDLPKLANHYSKIIDSHLA